MNVEFPMMAFPSILVLDIKAVPWLQGSKTPEFQRVEGQVRTIALQSLRFSQQRPQSGQGLLSPQDREVERVGAIERISKQKSRGLWIFYLYDFQACFIRSTHFKFLSFATEKPRYLRSLLMDEGEVWIQGIQIDSKTYLLSEIIMMLLWNLFGLLLDCPLFDDIRRSQQQFSLDQLLNALLLLLHFSRRRLENGIHNGHLHFNIEDFSFGFFFFFVIRQWLTDFEWFLFLVC